MSTTEHHPGQEHFEEQHFEEGLPDHHDPLGGIGGAPPAYSALTLRLVLAAFGLLVCVIAAVVFIVADAPIWIPIVLGVVALSAIVDFAVVARRKLRGEPG